MRIDGSRARGGLNHRGVRLLFIIRPAYGIEGSEVRCYGGVSATQERVRSSRPHKVGGMKTRCGCTVRNDIAGTTKFAPSFQGVLPMLLHLKARQQFNVAPGYRPRHFAGAPGFFVGRKFRPLLFKPVARPLLVSHARSPDGL